MIYTVLKFSSFIHASGKINSTQKFQGPILFSAARLISCEVPTLDFKVENNRNNKRTTGTTQAINGSAFWIPCNNFNPSGDSGCTCRSKLGQSFHFCDLKCASFAGVISLTTASAIQSCRTGWLWQRFPETDNKKTAWRCQSKPSVPPRTWQTLALTRGP